VTGAYPRRRDDGEHDAESPQLTYGYALIPRLDTLAEALDAGFATTDLGACALRMDASGDGGFVVHGTPGDARVDVLLAGPRTLYVEIDDDALVGPSEGDGPRWSLCRGPAPCQSTRGGSFGRRHT